MVLQDFLTSVKDKFNEAVDGIKQGAADLRNGAVDTGARVTKKVAETLPAGKGLHEWFQDAQNGYETRESPLTIFRKERLQKDSTIKFYAAPPRHELKPEQCLDPALSFSFTRSFLDQDKLIIKGDLKDILIEARNSFPASKRKQYEWILHESADIKTPERKSQLLDLITAYGQLQKNYLSRPMTDSDLAMSRYVLKQKGIENPTYEQMVGLAAFDSMSGSMSDALNPLNTIDETIRRQTEERNFLEDKPWQTPSLAPALGF